VDPWVATALAALFLVLGGGYECLVYPFTMSYTGALVLGLAALLLVDHDGGFGARDLAAWAVAVGALMCSGIGITMVVVMGAAALLRRGLRAAVVTVSVPALAFLVWFLAVGRGSTIPASKAQLLMIPAFVWTGLSHAAESAAGFPGAGPVLVLALLAMLLRQRVAVRHRAAGAAAAVLGAVAFLAVAGVGRIALGVDLATIPRYTYVTCALLLVAAGVVLTELGRASRAAALVVLVAVGAATLQGAGQLLDGARSRVAFLHPFQDTILASAWMVESREPLVAAPDALPEPKWSPDLTLAGLRQLVDEGAFGAVAPPSATARLAAALQLQVVTGDVAAVHGPPPRLSSTPADSRGGTGCAHLHEDGPVTVRLFFRAPAAVSITPAAAGQLTLAMATTADPNLLSAQRSFPLTAGHSTVLSIAAADAAPVLTLPAGDDLVCGLQL
jgi:stage V sporulation protein SpoVS